MFLICFQIICKLLNQRQNNVNISLVLKSVSVQSYLISHFHFFIHFISDTASPMWSIVLIEFFFSRTPCECESSLQRLMFSHAAPNITHDLIHSSDFKVIRSQLWWDWSLIVKNTSVFLLGQWFTALLLSVWAAHLCDPWHTAVQLSYISCLRFLFIWASHHEF